MAPTARPHIDLEQYEPDLPKEDWARVRQFVLDAVSDLTTSMTYPPAAIMTAVARHVDWCVNVAGMPMTRETLFRRDVIAAAVGVMDTTKSASKGRRRSLLLRAGETFGVIEAPRPLPPLSAASPATPYTADEVGSAIRWAEAQDGQNRRSAQALIALGFGAGLRTKDLTAVRVSDILDDGRTVALTDRGVPVLPDWQGDLLSACERPHAPELALFRPGVAPHKNMVTNFVSRSIGSGVRPSTQRMRATWLVEHLANGTPMQDLLAAAGLQSMDALVRYEVFLPPPSPAFRAGRTR